MHASLTGVVAAFQVALAVGAPWGALAMGGRYPGVMPIEIRVAEVFQALLLGFFAAMVLSRAGVLLPRWSRVSRRVIWVVVGMSAMSVVLNLATPSALERAIWAPVAIVMLVTALAVALSPVFRDSAASVGAPNEDESRSN